MLVPIACARFPIEESTVAPLIVSETPQESPTVSPPTDTPAPKQNETSTIAPTSTIASSSTTPTPQLKITFTEDFEQLNSSTWHMDKGSGNIAIEDSILQMTSSGKRYPYLYSQRDPFPEKGDFSVTIRFRYSRVRVCGVGVIISSYLAPAGLSQEKTANRMQESEMHGVLAGVWQDQTNGLLVWFRSGEDRVDLPFPVNSTWNEMTIDYIGNHYNLYLNGNRVYTSLETQFRPQHLWLGHPAELYTDCEWDTLEIDYIEITSIP